MERRVKSSFFKKFFYALKGLLISLKEEPSLVFHFVTAAIILIICGIINQKMQIMDWIIIVLVIGLMITLELVNTAIENICDMVSFKYNKSARKIKDISAAATLLFSITSLVIGLLIFIPKIIEISKGI